MKNKLLCLLLILTQISFVNIVFAQDGELYVLHELEDCKIVSTSKEEIATPHHGTVTIYKNYGVMDNSGNFILEPIYDKISPPVDNRATVILNGLYGYTDGTWRFAVEPIYSYGLDFSEGYAAVKNQEGFAGYIDVHGNVAVPFIYSSASSVINGKGRVTLSDEGYNFNIFSKEGTVDMQGNIIEPLIYRHPSDFQVLLSENDIEVNGVRYSNSELEYPYINYLGYAYIPLTYYGCRALGINCDWSAENGLVLSDGGTPDDGLVGNNPMQKGTYENATLYTGTITINGIQYTSGDIYYPLIQYRDVVYMPVLWKQGMEALGINYSYTLYESGTAPVSGCMIFSK